MRKLSKNDFEQLDRVEFAIVKRHVLSGLLRNMEL